MFNFHAQSLLAPSRQETPRQRYEERLPVSWPLPAPQAPRRPGARGVRFSRRGG
jgi:hypothetical protein